MRILSEEEFIDLTAAIVRALRKINKISQFEMGIILGVHQAGVARIELRQQRVTAYQIHIIKVYFDVDVYEFVEDEKEAA